MLKKALMPVSFILVILAGGLSGCATEGHYFKSDIDWIKPGQTTQQNALTVLGEPHSIGNSSGTPTWTYGYYHYRLIGKSRTKELKIYWDESKKIKNYSFTSSFPEDKDKVMKSASGPGADME